MQKTTISSSPLMGKAVLYSLTALAGIAMVAGVYYLQSEKWLQHQRVQGCMEVSSYTFTDGKGVTTVEPIETSYTKCLELKK
jgi:hypothetical protein